MTKKNGQPVEALPDLPFVVRCQVPSRSGKKRRQKKEKPLAPGDLCPQCLSGRLDYDGLLHLCCPNCGYSLTGGAGCT